jgi:Tol biopolymer transport system component
VSLIGKRAALLTALAATIAGCGSTAPAPPRQQPAAGAGRPAPQFVDEARIMLVSSAGGRATALGERDEHDHEHDPTAGGGHHDDDERQVDNPVWAPDERWIAFTRTPCEYCRPRLVLMTANGARERRLDRVRNAFQPSWAPGGKRLAILLPGPRSAIYSIGLDGSERRRIVGGRAALEAPSWSPAGGRLVYARQQSGTNWDIYDVPTRGGQPRRLTRDPKQETTPEFSPDGRRIAFARQRSSGGWAVYTMRADGTRVHRITGPGVSAVEPSWSPDGRRIAFTAQDPAGHSWIAVVGAGGGRIKRLTSRSLYATQPAWSPGGATVAFAARGRGSTSD